MSGGGVIYLLWSSLSLNLQFPEIDVLVIDFREKLLPDLGLFDVRFVNLVVVHKRRALDLESLLGQPSGLGKFSQGLIGSLFRSLETQFLYAFAVGKTFRIVETAGRQFELNRRAQSFGIYSRALGRLDAQRLSVCTAVVIFKRDP